MRDAHTPTSWGEAFAALPQEAPPASAWERASAHLERRRRNRAPAWIGLAAAAALVLSLTLLVRPEPRSAAPAPAPASVEPDHARLAQTPAKRETPAAVVEASEVAKTKPANVRIAAASATPAKRAATVAKPGMDRLYTLYAESAQLEALLDVARDDRVSSAGAVLLADELETQVAVIDASLSQPGLDDGERGRLWQARVDALRQAAGFESTQRLLASQGRSYVMLVSVD